MTFCKHRHEIAASTADGKPALRCVSCFRLRPHPWNQTPAQRRRWTTKLRSAKKGTVVYERELMELWRKPSK